MAYTWEERATHGDRITVWVNWSRLEITFYLRIILIYVGNVFTWVIFTITLKAGSVRMVQKFTSLKVHKYLRIWDVFLHSLFSWMRLLFTSWGQYCNKIVRSNSTFSVSCWIFFPLISCPFLAPDFFDVVESFELCVSFFLLKIHFKY